MTPRAYFALLFSGTLARLLMVNAAPLWYDENYTLILSRLPFLNMLRATAGDVHPPLHYLIVWTINAIMPNLPAWFIRVPSVIFSIIALDLFIKLCAALEVPTRVALVASWMMAILPMQIWYAQEGRMYALLEMLVLLGAYIVVTRRGAVWLWLVFAAMFYTQNYGLFYAAALCLVGLLRARPGELRRDFIWLAVSAAAAALLFAPWTLVIRAQMGEIEGRYWIMDARIGAALKTVYQQFWASAMIHYAIVPAYAITYLALMAGYAALVQERDPAALVIIPMSVFPLALAWMVSLAWQPILLFRPLIGSSPFLYLAAAWSVQHLRRAAYAPNLSRAGVAYVTALVLPLLIFGVGGYYRNIAAMKGEGAVSPMLGAWQYVRDHWREGDIILHTDDGPLVNLMPYAGVEYPQYYMPACDEQKTGYAPVLGSLSDTTRRAIGARYAELDDIPHKRAWIFAPRSPLHPKCYDDKINPIAPEGNEILVVDNNEYLSSGVWLVVNNE